MHESSIARLSLIYGNTLSAVQYSAELAPISSGRRRDVQPLPALL